MKLTSKSRLFHLIVSSSTKMCCYFIIHLCFVALVAVDVHSSSSEFRDYCEREFFKAQCDTDEVVVIRLARYGRMREGRCISNTYDVLGCSHDVRDVLDNACSGRRECSVLVANLVPENTQPCPKDFRSYLEVLYDCVKVISAKEMVCRNSRPVTLIPQPSGYLSGLVAEETGCGSLDNPWIVSVAEGQRIRFTLFDFGYSVNTASATGDSTTMCHVGAVIKEESATLSTTVCRSSQREDIIYTSQTRSAEVRLIVHRKRKIEAQFLIKYEAIGCATPPSPRGGWLGRVGERIIMGCNDSWTGVPRTWELICEDNVWKGRKFNCTSYEFQHASVLEEKYSDENFLTQPFGISIAIVTLIACGVCLLVLVAGIGYVRRRKLLQHNGDANLKYMAPANVVGKGEASEFHQIVTASRVNTADCRSGWSRPPLALPAYEQTQSIRQQQQQQHQYLSSNGANRPTDVYFSDKMYGDRPKNMNYFRETLPLSRVYAPNSVTEHIYESPKFVRKYVMSASEQGNSEDYYDVDHTDADYSVR